MSAQIIDPVATIDRPTFVGLQSYSEAQADIFFGRDEEKKALYRLIKNNTLTIIFGKSGTGKSSLLKAGVFPRLRAAYCLPFIIRLQFNDDSPDLITQVKSILVAIIEEHKFKVNALPGTETLWEYFHAEPLWDIVTPILVFDQFEEIFTLAHKSSRFNQPEIDAFIDELSSLVENTIPEKIKDQFINSTGELGSKYNQHRAKVILSFREDFLPEMESITAKIPSIKHSRFRLKQLNGKKAYEVITKTWGNAIRPAQANKIVYFFTNETETESIDVERDYGKHDKLEIEPSLLSQVCSLLDKKREDEGRNEISAEFLNRYSKEKILRLLYDDVLDESNYLKNFYNAKEGEAPRNLIKEFVEDKLITDEGYRMKYAITEVEDEIRPGVDILKKKYFIREEDDTIELTHDVIVTLVKSDREQRRKEIALSEERKKAKKKMRKVMFFALLAVLLVWIALAGTAYKTKVGLDETNDKLNDQKLALIDSIKMLDSIRIERKKDSSNTNRRLAGKTSNGSEIDSSSTSDATTGSLEIDFINNINAYNDSLVYLEKLIIDYRRDAAKIRDSIIAYRNRPRVDWKERQKNYTNLTNELAIRSKELDAREQRLLQMQKDIAAREEDLAKRQKAFNDRLSAINNRPREKAQPLLKSKPPKEMKGKVFGYGHDYPDSSKSN